MGLVLRIAWIIPIMTYVQLGCEASCLNGESVIQLSSWKGNISYGDDYKFADCSYRFPTAQSTQYDVLFMYVSDIHMTWKSSTSSGCAGHVTIGDNKFCSMPVDGCFLYYTERSKCSLQKLHEMFMRASPPCHKTSFLLVDSFPSTVRITSRDTMYKSVKIGYNHLKCQDESDTGEEESTNEAATPTTKIGGEIESATKGTSTSENSRKPSGCPKSSRLAEASSCDAAKAIAVSFGLILFIVVCLFGYNIYSRRRTKFSVNKGVEGAPEKDKASEEISRLSI